MSGSLCSDSFVIVFKSYLLFKFVSQQLVEEQKKCLNVLDKSYFSCLFANLIDCNFALL